MKSRCLFCLLFTLTLAAILAIVYTFSTPPCRGPARAAAPPSLLRSSVTLYAVTDATTTQSAPNQNFGSDPTLGVARTGVVGVVSIYAYLRFDLSSLPAASTIHSAQLQLYLVQWTDKGPYTVNAHAVTQSWDEGTIRWNNQPPQGALVDAPALTMSAGYKSWNVRTLVQDWLGGVQANHGVALLPAAGQSFQMVFHSREASANRPRLVIDYTAPMPTPTDTQPVPTATNTPRPCPDNYEPNDSFDEAPFLLPNTEYWAAICTPTDVDYYGITVVAGQLIRPELWDLPADYDLDLYGPDRSLIARSTDAGTTMEWIEHTAAVGGPYYIKVYGKGGAFDADDIYRFKVTLTGPPATPSPTPPCPDTYEPNETFASALLIAPGTYQSYICYPTDQDYFKFDVNQGDTIELRLASLPHNYDLRLFDPDEGEVASSHEPGTSDEVLKFQAKEERGEYRVLVYSAAGGASTTDSYLLTLTMTYFETPTPSPSPTPPSCDPDAYEPNDSFEEAPLVWVGTHLEALICPPGDQDYYRFFAPLGHDIELDLTSLPGDYDICLWSPDGLLYPYPAAACSRNMGTASEHVFARADVEGEFRAQVFPKAGINDWDAHDSYDLVIHLTSPTRTPTPTNTRTPTPTQTPTRTPIPPAPINLTLWVDDAAPGVEVAKLLPDADGLASRTWVDVVVEAHSVRQVWPLDIVLQVPTALGDPVHVWRRDCCWCDVEDYMSAMTPLSPGRYQVRLNLYPNWTTGEYRHQLAFRFALTPTSAGGRYRVQASTGATAEHQAATSNGGSINVLYYAPAVVLTNRRCLFNHFRGQEAWTKLLLQTVHDLATATPLSVVYYVDKYSDAAANWNPYAISYWSTANIVANIVDDLIEDWADDGSARPLYLLIVGDDPVVPYLRVNDPVGSENNHAYSGVHPILDALTQHDGFFSDAKYADLNDRSWKHHPADLAVGRIVGARPWDMITFINSGQAGPKVGSGHFVAATWAEFNFDHEYDVQGPIRRFGFNILYDGVGPFETIDIVDHWYRWRKADLVHAMQQGFACMGYGGHGEHNWITVPEKDADGNRMGITASELPTISTNGAHMEVNHPILCFGACRVGFSLAYSADHSFVYSLAREGASAVLASAGIMYGRKSCAGVEYDAWGEVLPQLFWRKLLNRRYATAGLALREARESYDEGVRWDDKDEKTIMEFMLFGLPSAYLPEIPEEPSGGVMASSPGLSLSATFGLPQAGETSGTYTLHTLVDASDYRVDREAIPDFDLIAVTRMEQTDDGDVPVLPYTMLTLTLPVGAEVTEVSVFPSNPVVIENVNLPMIVPAIPMEGAPPGGFIEVPDDLGIYPTEPYTYHVTESHDHQYVAFYLLPASYDPANDQATLQRSLVVTVHYRAEVPFVLMDLAPERPLMAADQPVAVLATAMNVGDAGADLTPVLTLYNALNQPVGTWSGAAVHVPAGGSAEVRATSGQPVANGTYLARLKLEEQGTPVAEGETALTVAGGRLTDLAGPRWLRPGQSGTFTVTFDNLLGHGISADLTLEVLDEHGQVVAQRTASRTAPGQGQAHASFEWTAAQDAGAFMVRVWAQVGEQSYGPLSRPLHVGAEHSVYLPVVLKQTRR